MSGLNIGKQEIIEKAMHQQDLTLAIERIKASIPDVIENVDYYQKNRPAKPKAEIADYIESEGFLVPRRYKNLEQALAQPREDCPKIILRSEHQQDYDGRSGDLPSWMVLRRGDGKFEVSTEYSYGLEFDDPKKILEDFEEDLINSCKIAGFSVENVSFSIWECIEGENLAIAADTSVPGRYHFYKTQGHFHSYDILEKDRGDLGELERMLINQYEKIRNLGRFDNMNCPIMEFQLGKDQKKDMIERLYFLQYLKTRKTELANFSLEKRDLEDGEVEAAFVRGITSEEGEFIDFSYIKFYDFGYSKPDGVVFQTCSDNIDSEELDKLALAGYSLCMVYDRISDSKYESRLFHMIRGHASRSFIHKPRLSIVIPEWRATGLFSTNGAICDYPDVKVHIISDGKRAILRKIEEL